MKTWKETYVIYYNNIDLNYTMGNMRNKYNLNKLPSDMLKKNMNSITTGSRGIQFSHPLMFFQHLKSRSVVLLSAQ